MTCITFFTVDEVGTLTNPGKGIHYSVYNTGTGNLEPGNTNKPLLPRCAEKITVIRHSNGTDYWIIAREINTFVFKVFLLSSSGITVQEDQVIGTDNKVDDSGTSRPVFAKGYLKASPDGRFLAQALEGNKTIDVYPFDPLTGRITNVIYLSGISGETDFGAYGLEFSPTSKYLYGTNKAGKIYCWDLDVFGQEAVQSSRRIIWSSDQIEYGALQLAPNGKIYIARTGQNYLGVINAPDFEECQFREQGASLIKASAQADGTCGYGLPNFPADYFRNDIFYVNDCHGTHTILYFNDELFDHDPTWYIDDVLVADAAYNVAFQFPEPGVHTIHLLGSKNGGRVEADRDIFIHPLPDPDYEDEGAICGGTPYELISDEWAFWAWTTGLESGADKWVYEAGDYQVQVTNYEGCSAGYSTLVTSGPVPRIESITVDSASCGNPDGQITIQMVDGLSGYHFRWLDSEETLNARSNLAAGDYRVIITSDQCGYLDSTITVKNKDFQINLMRTPSDVTVCPGTEVILEASGAETYTWLNPAGTTGEQVIVHPEMQQIYRVVGEKGGCRDTAQTEVIVFPDYKPDLGEDLTACAGEIVTISREDLEYGQEYQSWLWSPGASSEDHIDINSTTPELILTVKDRNGCTSKDTIAVFFRPLPVFNAIPKNRTCFDSDDAEIQIGVEGNAEDFEYSIDGGEAWVDTNVFTGLYPGSYQVRIREKNPPGCFSEMKSLEITSPEPITATDSLRKPFCLSCEDGEIYLAVKGGTPEYTVTWGDREFVREGDLYKLGNLIAGIYEIEITDHNGCSWSQSILLEAEPFFVPTAFSPNGDQKNPTWVIDGLDGWDEVTIQVFDRSGSLVFKAGPKPGGSFVDNDRWDGTYLNKGTREMPAGTYFYKIDVVRDNETKVFRGTVTILR